MDSKIVRCKLICHDVTNQSYEKYNKETGKHEKAPVYSATFGPVYSGTVENEAFFAATPSASLILGVHAKQHFEVGKEYYIDITEAPTPEPTKHIHFIDAQGAEHHALANSALNQNYRGSVGVTIAGGDFYGNVPHAKPHEKVAYSWHHVHER